LNKNVREKDSTKKSSEFERVFSGERGVNHISRIVFHS
jgi:hypothetical protein